MHLNHNRFFSDTKLPIKILFLILLSSSQQLPTTCNKNYFCMVDDNVTPNFENTIHGIYSYLMRFIKQILRTKKKLWMKIGFVDNPKFIM